MAFGWKPVSCQLDLYLYRTADDMAEKFSPEKNHSVEGGSAFYCLVLFSLLSLLLFLFLRSKSRTLAHTQGEGNYAPNLERKRSKEFVDMSKDKTY